MYCEKSLRELIARKHVENNLFFRSIKETFKENIQNLISIKRPKYVITIAEKGELSSICLLAIID